MSDTTKIIFLIGIITALSVLIFNILIEKSRVPNIKYNYPDIAIDMTEDFGTQMVSEDKIIKRKVDKNAHNKKRE